MKKLILAAAVSALSITFTVFAEESFSPKPRRNTVEDVGFTHNEKAASIQTTQTSTKKNKNFEEDMNEQDAEINSQIKMMEDLKAKSEALMKQLEERQNASDKEQ
jgi:hypothetical protein